MTQLTIIEVKQMTEKPLCKSKEVKSSSIILGATSQESSPPASSDNNNHNVHPDSRPAPNNQGDNLPRRSCPTEQDQQDLSDCDRKMGRWHKIIRKDIETYGEAALCRYF